MKNRVKTILAMIGSIVLSMILIGIFLIFSIYVAVLKAPSYCMPQKSDVIIIPGAKTGSLSLHCRCDRALELYKKGYTKKIITTGGKGPDEDITEAQDAANYLVSRGVLKSDIYMENTSVSTQQNLSNAKKIMDSNVLKSAIIASDDFHIYRCLEIAKGLNIPATGAASVNNDDYHQVFTIREVGIMLVYRLTFKI